MNDKPTDVPNLATSTVLDVNVTTRPLPSVGGLPNRFDIPPPGQLTTSTGPLHYHCVDHRLVDREAFAAKIEYVLNQAESVDTYVSARRKEMCLPDFDMSNETIRQYVGAHQGRLTAMLSLLDMDTVRRLDLTGKLLDAQLSVDLIGIHGF